MSGCVVFRLPAPEGEGRKTLLVNFFSEAQSSQGLINVNLLYQRHLFCRYRNVLTAGSISGNISQCLCTHPLQLVAASRWWKINLHQTSSPAKKAASDDTTDASQARVCFIWWEWQRGCEGFNYSLFIGLYCLHGHVWFSQPVSGVLYWLVFLMFRWPSEFPYFHSLHIDHVCLQTNWNRDIFNMSTTAINK